MSAGAMPWRQAERRVRDPVEGSAGRMAATVPQTQQIAFPGATKVLGALAACGHRAKRNQRWKSGSLQNRLMIGSYGRPCFLWHTLLEFGTTIRDLTPWERHRITRNFLSQGRSLTLPRVLGGFDGKRPPCESLAVLRNLSLLVRPTDRPCVPIKDDQSRARRHM
jgi:hypothetical protein